MRRIIVFFVSLLLLAAALPLQTAGAQEDELCFDVPGIANCIAGRFRQYWQLNGGLPVFGYPTSPPINEQTAEGTFVTQYFERNRFEYHPELEPPYDVQLGRLGDVRLQQLGRNWFTFPKAEPSAPHYFADTGHAIAHEPFWRYWSSHGLRDPQLSPFGRSLALFGFPLSEPAMETNANGDTVLTQWFERARFEDHGDKGVLLGLLGNETRSAPQPGPSPADCSGIPAPVDARIRPSNCIPSGTRLAIDIYGFEPNEDVGYWLTAPDGTQYGPSQTAKISATGGADNLGLPTSNFQPGLWFIVFEGTESKHQSIIYFKILPAGS